MARNLGSGSLGNIYYWMRMMFCRVFAFCPSRFFMAWDFGSVTNWVVLFRVFASCPGHLFMAWDFGFGVGGVAVFWVFGMGVVVSRT